MVVLNAGLATHSDFRPQKSIVGLTGLKENGEA